MPPSRRRSNFSLFESSTLITANLIMASSSYLLSRIKPRAPAAQSTPPAKVAGTGPRAWPPATRIRSVEPMAGCRTVFMEPDDGQYGKVDQEAETYVKRFRARTQSEKARQEAPTAAVRSPQPPVASAKWGGAVHRYSR